MDLLTYANLGGLIVLALGAAAAVLLIVPGLRDRLFGRRAPVPQPVVPAEVVEQGWLSLASCPQQSTACLRCVGVDQCIVHRLTELGLTPGVELQVVHDAGGPLLVAVRGSRVALGRELAENLWVEVQQPCGCPVGVCCRCPAGGEA